MSRMWFWGAGLVGVLTLALVWWAWQNVGLAALQLGMGACL
ncbi:hypothetical protein [Pseudomonas viridiflava]|nr:hypothetical protein [Pseudomonas viridiflava]